MIVVDTSVWIDYFNGVPTSQAGWLDDLLGERVLVVGDLILAELLQGFAAEADARRALSLLEPLEFMEMAGRDVAIQSAANYRHLRRRGITVRKTEIHRGAMRNHRPAIKNHSAEMRKFPRPNEESRLGDKESHRGGEK